MAALLSVPPLPFPEVPTLNPVKARTRPEPLTATGLMGRVPNNLVLVLLLNVSNVPTVCLSELLWGESASYWEHEGVRTVLLCRASEPKDMGLKEIFSMPFRNSRLLLYVREGGGVEGGGGRAGKSFPNIFSLPGKAHLKGTSSQRNARQWV